MKNKAAFEIASKTETSIQEGTWLIEQYILAKKGKHVTVSPTVGQVEALRFVSAVNIAKDYFINEPTD